MFPWGFFWGGLFFQILCVCKMSESERSLFLFLATHQTARRHNRLRKVASRCSNYFSRSLYSTHDGAVSIVSLAWERVCVYATKLTMTIFCFLLIESFWLQTLHADCTKPSKRVHTNPSMGWLRTGWTWSTVSYFQVKTIRASRLSFYNLLTRDSSVYTPLRHCDV